MKRATPEILAFATLTAFCLFSFRSLLFTGASTLPHDNLYWFYPLFQHYAESLLNGQLPLWNPFEHGGEPFYPVLISGRFLDPVFPIVVLIGGRFTHDTLTLLHWTLFTEAWLNVLGSYLFLRLLAPTLWARIAVLPVLFFSIFMVGWLRQPGLLLAFTWIPFIAYYLLKLTYLRDRRIANWILLGAFIGLNWQFYYFVATWLVLFFVGAGLLIFHREATLGFFRGRGAWRGPALTLGIAGLMLAPNASLYFSQDDFVFPARMMSVEKRDTPVRGPINHEGGPENITSAVQLPYSVLAYTGTVACLWDYLQGLLPEPSFRSANGWDGTWRIFHDGHGYFGMLVWALACAGIFFAPSTYRGVVLFALAGLALFSLGPGGAIHPILYRTYPPAQFMRHTLLIIGSVYLLLLVPFLAGLEYFFRLSRREIPFPRLLARDLFWGYTILLSALLGWILRHPTHEDWAWVPLTVAAGAGWALRKRVSPLGYWIALTFSPILVALSAAVSVAPAILYAVALIGAPLASLYRKKPRVTQGIVVGTLLLDFVTSYSLQAMLWETKPRPSTFLSVTTTAQPTRLPVTRRLYAPGFTRDPQAIRYLATAYREPTAFSTPYTAAKDFAGVLKVPRWNSFLLPRNYFELIHSGLPGDALERMFAIERRLFQYKRGAIEVTETGYSELFPQGDASFLDSFVLVPPGTEGLPLFDGKKVVESPTGFAYRAREYAHGNFTIDVRAERAGILYFADGYDESWSAFIDDKPVPIVRANKNFKAVALPAGEHAVHFLYRPWGFLVAAGLFYLVFVLSITIAIVLQRRVKIRGLSPSLTSLVDHSC